MSVSPRLVAVLALMGSLVSLTVGTSFAKHLFPEVGAPGAIALRVCLSALILCAVWRPWRARLGWRDLGRLARYGAIMGAMNLLFYLSLRTLPLGLAIAIEFCGPLAVAIFASRRLLDFVWIAFAAAGLLLLSPLNAGAQAIDPVGAAYALAAAVCWALYIIYGKRVSHLHAGQSVAIGMTVSALIVGPIGLWTAGAALFQPWVLGLGLMVAIASSAIPYSLEMVSLKRLPNQVFGILLSLEPAMGALAAYLILGERLGPLQLAAIASIVVASAGMALTGRPAPPALESVAI